MREIDDGFVYEERRHVLHDVERFDRVKFAMRALHVLRPRGIRVAVYAAGWDLRVEQGRDFSPRPETSWAMVGIPPDASRHHIALALAELAGVARLPFVLDLLCQAGDEALARFDDR